MSEPTAGLSGWDKATEQAPGSRRGLVIGCLALVALLVVSIVGFLLLTPFPRGLGAAIAIADRGKPDVVGANYSLTTSAPATMRVYLAPGVGQTRARQLGCGVVRDELSRAQSGWTGRYQLGADRIIRRGARHFIDHLPLRAGRRRFSHAREDW